VRQAGRARPFRYGRRRPPRGHHHALHRRSRWL